MCLAASRVKSLTDGRILIGWFHVGHAADVQIPLREGNLDTVFTKCLVDRKVDIADGFQAAVDIVKISPYFKVQ